MAKEMMIIFVYDTEMVQKEEDDPATAILYFHPTWVSDQQKAALCGQIMGTIQCLKSIFATPKIVALQSGKFFIIENGRYLLAIGTDRNVADWLLEHRANTLYSLVNFFHKDFLSLSRIYEKTDNFSAKLYHLFETYLKMLFFGGNLFSHIPTISLPKSASNVFSESIHILQCCQELTNVLGGTMLYHNKIVATQLSPDLTKRLVLTDPYRIKCPAEVAEIDFELPLGVQLLQVYVPNQEYSSLLETSIRNRSIFQYLNNNKSIKKIRNVSSTQPDPIISTMKRDQSLIFTAVPEEGTNATEELTFVPVSKKARPKFLNLKSISIEGNVSEVKTVTTPFCGQTSVCSTPMTDLKKFIHQNPLSICLNEQDEQKETIVIQESSQKFTLRKCSSLPQLFNNKNSSSPNDIKKAKSIINITLCEENINIKPKEEIKKECTANNNKQEHLAKRKSLTLPLKSLSNNEQTEQQICSPLISSNTRKYSTGVQLTPLMSKLSMLAFEERSSGFGSHESTPNLFTPTQSQAPMFHKKILGVAKDLKRNVDDGGLQKCVLFVCGQQDVVLLLLLKEDCCRSPDVITKLWELCTEELGKLEKQLRFCMESQPGSNAHENEQYSYLYLDAEWDTLQRAGPWGGSDQGTLSSLHRDFYEMNSVTEILVRGSDSVVYGYHCGQTEVYYHESAGINAGLPTPADPMAVVQLKAKRRLERDHAIILL